MKRLPFALIVLLGVTLLVRTYHITIQGAFLDEGFHAQRASLVYHFNVNSLTFADGKLLIYYWLGLFQGQPQTALFVSRFAVALFSLITVAAVYAIGRRLYSPSAGFLAALLYAFLPLAVFHERLALADPLAGGLVCLVAWHGLTLAAHPTRRNGAIQGVLLALALLAKLSVFLVVLLPFATCLIYASATIKTRDWLRSYWPALASVVAGLALVWIPLLALMLATHSPLFAAGVVGGGAFSPASPGDYLLTIFPPLIEFIGLPLLIACAVAFVVLFLGHHQRLQIALFLLTWLVLIIMPLISFASIPAVRYFVPIAAPLALLIGCGALSLSDELRKQPMVRVAIATAVVLWLGTFGVPFAYTAATAPDQLPLTGNNRLTYLGDVISADQTVRMVASTAHALDASTPIYGDWQLCRLLYFYVTRPVNCLDAGNLQQSVQTAVQTSSPLYVIAGSALVPAPTFCQTTVKRFTRPDTDPILIWRVLKAPC